jgi:hypothetical protein
MENTAKLIALGVLTIIGLHLLMSLLPYLVVAAAMVGVWRLYEISRK